MGLEIPDSVKWLSWIIGADWPEGDETAMRRAADAWTEAATAVRELTEELQGVAAEVQGALQGYAAEQFRMHWETWVTADPQRLTKLAESCDNLAKVLNDGATDIEYAKYMFIALLIITAIEIILLIKAAFATFGASTAAIPAVEAAAQVSARIIFQRLLSWLARNAIIHGAVMGALEGGGLDLLIQGIQVAQGNRDGINWNQTLRSTVDGAIGGAISGAVGGGMRRIPGLDDAADTALGNAVKGAVREGASEAISGALGTVATAAVHGESVSLEDIAKGATSGAAGGAIGGARGGLTDHNSGGGTTGTPGDDGGTGGNDGGAGSDGGTGGDPGGNTGSGTRPGDSGTGSDGGSGPSTGGNDGGAGPSTNSGSSNTGGTPHTGGNDGGGSSPGPSTYSGSGGGDGGTGSSPGNSGHPGAGSTPSGGDPGSGGSPSPSTSGGGTNDGGSPSPSTPHTSGGTDGSGGSPQTHGGGTPSGPSTDTSGGGTPQATTVSHNDSGGGSSPSPAPQPTATHADGGSPSTSGSSDGGGTSGGGNRVASLLSGDTGVGGPAPGTIPGPSLASMPSDPGASASPSAAAPPPSTPAASGTPSAAGAPAGGAMPVGGAPVMGGGGAAPSHGGGGGSPSHGGGTPGTGRPSTTPAADGRTPAQNRSEGPVPGPRPPADNATGTPPRTGEDGTGGPRRPGDEGTGTPPRTDETPTPPRTTDDGAAGGVPRSGEDAPGALPRTSEDGTGGTPRPGDEGSAAPPRIDETSTPPRTTDDSPSSGPRRPGDEGSGASPRTDESSTAPRTSEDGTGGGPRRPGDEGSGAPPRIDETSTPPRTTDDSPSSGPRRPTEDTPGAPDRRTDGTTPPRDDASGRPPRTSETPAPQRNEQPSPPTRPADPATNQPGSTLSGHPSADGASPRPDTGDGTTPGRPDPSGTPPRVNDPVAQQPAPPGTTPPRRDPAAQDAGPGPRARGDEDGGTRDGSKDEESVSPGDSKKDSEETRARKRATLDWDNYYLREGQAVRRTTKPDADGNVLPPLRWDAKAGQWEALPPDTPVQRARYVDDGPVRSSVPPERSRELQDLINERSEAIDRAQEAAENYKKDKSPENKETRREAFEEQTRYGEQLGEEAANDAFRDILQERFGPRDDLQIEQLFPRPTPDGEAPQTARSGEFDQVYKVHDPVTGQDHYFIVEAKGPSAQLGSRKGEDGFQYQQGRPEYVESIFDAMQNRGGADARLARELRAAFEDRQLEYHYARARVDLDDNGDPYYAGYERRQFDIYSKPDDAADGAGTDGDGTPPRTDGDDSAPPPDEGGPRHRDATDTDTRTDDTSDGDSDGPDREDDASGEEIPDGLPADLHDVYRDSEATPAGRAFYGPDDTAMRDLAQRVPADPNRFVVDAHGDPDGVIVDGRRLSADEVAALISNDPNWNGREVMLLSCDTADGTFAQQLADRLGVPVTAPHGLAWSDNDGNVYASSGSPGPDGRKVPDMPPNGGWTTHHPHGEPTPAGQGGYAPGHPVTAAPRSADPSAASRGNDPPPTDPRAPAADRTTGTDPRSPAGPRPSTDGHPPAAAGTPAASRPGTPVDTSLSSEGRSPSGQGTLADSRPPASPGTPGDARVPSDGRATGGPGIPAASRPPASFGTSAESRTPAGPGTTPADPRTPSDGRPGTPADPRSSDPARPAADDGRAPTRSEGDDGGDGAPRTADEPLPGLPDHLQDVFRDSDRTPAGRSFYGPEDGPMRDLARRVPADPDRYVVDGHGDQDGMRVGDRRLDVDDVAALIRSDPNWNGREVMLLSCQTGDGDFAAQLASRLGVPVTAPNGLAWSDDGGNVFTSSGHRGPDGRLHPDMPPNGGWTIHHPDGRAAPTGRDGHAPGHPVDRSGQTQPDGETASPRGPGRRSPHQQADWNPRYEHQKDIVLAPGERIADRHDLDPETRYRVLQRQSDGSTVVRTIAYTGEANSDGHGRVTHVSTPGPGPNATLGFDPNDNPDLTQPEPGVVHRVHLGIGDPHVFRGGDDRLSPPAAPFDPPTHVPGIDPPQEIPRRQEVHNPELPPEGSGPFSLRDDLDPYTRYEVRTPAPENRLHGIFYTNGDGKVQWVRTWYGDSKQGWNPELGTEHTRDGGLRLPRPNTNYMVEPRERFQDLDPDEFDPPAAVRTGDLGDDVDRGTFLYHTDENGQTDAATGKPDYNGGGDRYPNVQGAAGAVGRDEYSPYRLFDGGHIFGHAGRGPGEAINYFPQWRVENQGWNRDGTTRPTSWYQLEQDLRARHKHPTNHIEIERFEFFAEPNLPGRTPQVVHVRWVEVDSKVTPPVRTVHYRSFYNLPPHLRGTPPQVPQPQTPPSSSQPSAGQAQQSAPQGQQSAPSTQAPASQTQSAASQTPAPPVFAAARGGDLASAPGDGGGAPRPTGDGDVPPQRPAGGDGQGQQSQQAQQAEQPDSAAPARASEETLRRIQEDPRVQRMLEEAGEPLGDRLRGRIEETLPNHPDLARIVAGENLSSLEAHLRDSLLSRPKTLDSLLGHPEAVRILEQSVADVDRLGPDAFLDGSGPKAEPTPLTDEQRRVSEDLSRSIAENRRPGEDPAPRVAPPQPGFDPTRADPAAGRDDPYINSYLDGLYQAMRESVPVLRSLVEDPAIRELGGEPHLRPGEKDRVRALDKIMGDYGGDASRLNDLLGAKIQFDTVADLYRALADIQTIAARHGVEVVSFKDRLQKPVPSGYRDAQLTVRMPNGHIGELRLHLRSIDEVAAYEHSLYEARRDLPNAAEEQNRPMTREEDALDRAINQRVIGRFQEALDRALQDPGSSAPSARPDPNGPSEPSRPADPSGPATPPASRDAAPPASGTGTDLSSAPTVPSATPRPDAAAHYGWYQDTPTVSDTAPTGHADAPTRDAPQPPPPDGVPSDLPAHLHDVFRDSQETPAGRAFFGPDEDGMRDLARRVPADPNRFVVDGHGDADGMRVGSRRLSLDDVAALIRNDPNWNGREVLLLSCRTGDGDFAAELSRRLGVPVLAPNGPAWSDTDGNVFASTSEPGPDGRPRPTWPPNGSWTAHHPNGTRTPAGENGYAPGHDGRRGAQENPDGAAARGDQGTDLSGNTANPDPPARTENAEGKASQSDPGHHLHPESPYNERFAPPNHPTITIPVPGVPEGHPHSAPRPGEPFSHRTGLEPNTRYVVPGRGTFWTNEQCEVRWVSASTPNREGEHNPDVHLPLPNTHYEVSTEHGTLRFTTDANALPPGAAIWDPPTDVTEANVPGAVDRHGKPIPTPKPGEGLDRRIELPPKTKLRVVDSHGNFDAIYYTDAKGDIRWIETESGRQYQNHPELGANLRKGVEYVLSNDLGIPKKDPGNGDGNSQKATVDGKNEIPERKTARYGETPPGMTDKYVHLATDDSNKDLKVTKQVLKDARTNPQLQQRMEETAWSRLPTKTDPFIGRSGVKLDPNTRYIVEVTRDKDAGKEPYAVIHTGKRGEIVKVEVPRPFNPYLMDPPPNSRIKVLNGLTFINIRDIVQVPYSAKELNKKKSHAPMQAMTQVPDYRRPDPKHRRSDDAQRRVAKRGKLEALKRGQTSPVAIAGGHGARNQEGAGGEDAFQVPQRDDQNSGRNLTDEERAQSWYMMEEKRVARARDEGEPITIPAINLVTSYQPDKVMPEVMWQIWVEIPMMRDGDNGDEPPQPLLFIRSFDNDPSA